MDIKKSHIPLKVFISYIALAVLAVSVGWILYSEKVVFSETETKLAAENHTILKVSNLLSNLYKTESLARLTLQSNSEKDFENYSRQSAALRVEIDSLKTVVTSNYQITLLDSVNYLLSEKKANIQQLKTIKNKADDEIAVNKAIQDLTQMEVSLKKLQLQDFVKDPNNLGAYQRSVLIKYVNYLNQNIPSDATNTLSQKALDSVLVASKMLLKEVSREMLLRSEKLNREERKLLQNEMALSEQLRNILNVIEREIILNTTKSNSEKETVLKKTNEIVAIAALIGFLLTLFFSVLILSDFSKTESYKKQLEIANSKAQSILKNREQLIATVSHDLKTPLSTIVGYTELIGHSELNKKQDYYIKNIKSASGYITQLVQDLLDFTQIEAGKITIESIPFSLKEMLHEVAKSIQSVYANKNIALRIETDETFNNSILSDPFRLRQILTNIIGNAFKFTEKGFIQIEAKANLKDGWIQIRIADSGIGIQKDKQQLIFEEFTQADDSIEKSYGGTGLGLTISKKMVEILGGKLSLNSDYGKGSTFKIYIPLQLAPLPTLDTQAIALQNKRILVLDDDLSFLSLTTEILEQKNYRVLSFSQAKEALQALKNTPLDAIITDIQMPGIDGFAFLEQLKKLSTHSNLPVIALTGRTDLEQNSYTDAGFTAVVRKPYTPQKLIQVLETILTNRILSSEKTITDTSVPGDKLYSLETIASFLPDDTHALNEVLIVFLQSSKENLVLLEKAIAAEDRLEIRDISHRMYPMFKQLHAKEIGILLEDFERKQTSLPQLNLDFQILKTKIQLLFVQLEREIHYSKL